MIFRKQTRYQKVSKFTKRQARNVGKNAEANPLLVPIAAYYALQTLVVTASAANRFRIWAYAETVEAVQSRKESFKKAFKLISLKTQGLVDDVKAKLTPSEPEPKS